MKYLSPKWFSLGNQFDFNSTVCPQYGTVELAFCKILPFLLQGQDSGSWSAKVSKVQYLIITVWVLDLCHMWIIVHMATGNRVSIWTGLSQGPAKRGHLVAGALLAWSCFPVVDLYHTCKSCVSWTQKLFLKIFRNIFVSMRHATMLVAAFCHGRATSQDKNMLPPQCDLVLPRP